MTQNDYFTRIEIEIVTLCVKHSQKQLKKLTKRGSNKECLGVTKRISGKSKEKGLKTNLKMANSETFETEIRSRSLSLKNRFNAFPTDVSVCTNVNHKSKLSQPVMKKRIIDEKITKHYILATNRITTDKKRTKKTQEKKQKNGLCCFN